MIALHSLLLFTAFVTISSRSLGSNSNSQTATKVYPEDNIVGVAAVAGVASRNGRVSATNGVRYYPGQDPIVKSVLSRGKTYYPITVSAEKDGRFASGTVQVYPGYVSSSASAGYIPKGNNLQNSFKRFEFPNVPPQALYKNLLYERPRDLFAPANLDNLFANDFFKFPSPTADVLRNGWLIPGFNPFENFWR